jgi:hypothetical protein
MAWMAIYAASRVACGLSVDGGLPIAEPVCGDWSANGARPGIGPNAALLSAFDESNVSDEGRCAGGKHANLGIGRSQPVWAIE